MISGFHHTGLVVRDLDRMVRFYRDDIGLPYLHEVNSIAPPTGDHTGIPSAQRTLVFLGYEQGHKIELVYYREPEASEGHLDKHQFSAMHICFNVDDLEAVHRTLSDKGVKFVTEPKYSEPPGGSRVGIVYAQDPEDNWIEFIQWDA